jgi:hypothetical protein
MSEQQREEDRGRAAAAAGWAGQGAAPKTTFSVVQAFMTSTPVVASTVTAAFVISGIGWSDMARRDRESDSHLAKSSVAAKVRPKAAAYAPKLVEGLPGASPSGPNALEMFRRSNRDAVRADAARAAAETSIGEAYRETPEEAAELEDAAASQAPASAPLERLKEVDAFGAAADGSGKKDPDGKKKAKKLAKSFARPRMEGGGGLAGGFNRGFDVPIQKSESAAPPVERGRLSEARGATRRRTGRAVSGSRSKRAGGVQGAAKKLKSMNKAMKAAKGSGSATTASTHNSQWDGSGAVGRSISGSGASGNAIRGGGQVYDEGGIGEGGPINAGSSASAPPSEQEQAPAVGKGKNVTPNQKLIDSAMILLPIASLLLLASFLLGRNAATQGAAEMIAYGAMAVSAVVTGLGVMIAAKGQTMQGGLLAAVGGVLTVISYTSAKGNAEAAKADELAKREAIQWAGPDDPTAGTSNLA